MKVCVYILSLISPLLLIACAETLPTDDTSVDKEDVPNQMDYALFQKNKNYEDFYQLLTGYLQRYPEEEKWVAWYLGLYYESHQDYDKAKEYYRKASSFSYSEIDALLKLNRLLYLKPVPRQEAYYRVLENWERLVDMLPHNLGVRTEYYLVKDSAPENEWYRSSDESDFYAEQNLFKAHNDDLSVYKEPLELYRIGKKYFDTGVFTWAINYYTQAAYSSSAPNRRDIAGPAEEKKWMLEFGEEPPLEGPEPFIDPIWGNDENKVVTKNTTEEKNDEAEKKEFSNIDWTPVYFNKVSECYIKKAQSSEGVLKNREKLLPALTGLRKQNEENCHNQLLQQIIEEYKTAIYYYHRACWGYPELYQLNLPRIKQLRQKIAEIDQIKKQKEPEQAPDSKNPEEEAPLPNPK